MNTHTHTNAVNRYNIENLEAQLKKAIFELGYAWCALDWQGSHEDMSRHGYCEGVADTLAHFLIADMKAEHYIHGTAEGKAAYEAGKKAWQDEQNEDEEVI